MTGLPNPRPTNAVMHATKMWIIQFMPWDAGGAFKGLTTAFLTAEAPYARASPLVARANVPSMIGLTGNATISPSDPGISARDAPNREMLTCVTATLQMAG